MPELTSMQKMSALLGTRAQQKSIEETQINPVHGKASFSFVADNVLGQLEAKITGPLNKMKSFRQTPELIEAAKQINALTTRIEASLYKKAEKTQEVALEQSPENNSSSRFSI